MALEWSQDTEGILYYIYYLIYYILIVILFNILYYIVIVHFLDALVEFYNPVLLSHQVILLTSFYFVLWVCIM